MTPFEKLRSSMRAEGRKAFKAAPRLTVPEWADTYRVLSKSVGATGGPWRTARVELARGPMMAVTEPGVRTITCKTATQLLKTSLLENVIGYFCHMDPSPMLLTQPKEGSVKAFSKERLQPMAQTTPVLREILGGHGKNDTQSYREFPGGFLAMESAGSPTNLAMRAIRVTLADEIDKYEPTKEGDPLLLLEERAATFMNTRLHIRCCSPTRADTSRITKSYEESDQRRPFVACPHCQHEFVLDFFKHVEWSKSEDGKQHFPYTAAIYCPDCGCEWSEADRLRLVTTKFAIRWKQTHKFVCCPEKQPESNTDKRQDPMAERLWAWNEDYQIGYALCKHCGKQAVPNAHAGYNGGKMHSPFITIPELAAKWISAKDDPETKQTFMNTQLGLEYQQDTVKQADNNVLMSRAEVYAAEAPAGVIAITMGVDVQSAGYLQCETVGWGLGEESWSLDTPVFPGDLSTPGPWLALDKYMKRTFEREGGGRLVVLGACIDSGGHYTEEVYKFARARLGRCIWPIKGANDRPGQKSPVWPIPKLEMRKTRQSGYKPVILGTGAAKESIYQRLMLTEPGPGYCHFPVERQEEQNGVSVLKYNEAWFEQLTAERQVLEKKNGYGFTRWVLPSGRANEALDTRVYAYAALQGLYAVRKLSLKRAATQIEMELSRRTAPDTVAVTAGKLLAALTPPAPADAPAPAPAPPRPIRRPQRARVSRSRFMS